MKKNNKYNYVDGRQINEDSGRVYDVAGYRLPSVTSILSRTKDQQFIKDWKAKVGEKRAEEIKNLSSVRGTAMHKYLESYIQEIGYEDLTDIGRQAKSMSDKVIEIGLAPVDEYYGSEVTMYYPGLYAGQTDLVCMHNGEDAIVDFKQSNRPKKKEWIEDYYLQIAAYAMAHTRRPHRTWATFRFVMSAVTVAEAALHEAEAAQVRDEARRTTMRTIRTMKTIQNRWND